MPEKIITIGDSITVNELAEKLNLPVTRLVGELFKNGIMATINQKIDFDTATIILSELGIDDVELQKKEVTTNGNGKKVHEISDKAVPRPPIVAMMGHVDHGKTSLLDAILNTEVVSGEAGGITQHISAYQAKRGDRVITLLDTPGHEAFASIRQHGAELTDIVIIVVAADDGVKPQTVEAIKFARSANAKMIIAINKIDKSAADSARVKTQLASEYNLNPEEWGGDTVMVEVSAKTGQNIDKLLDMTLLVADMEDLKADVDVPAEGLVIEANLEAGRGALVGLLIKQGTLKTGQFIVAGMAYGKVRTINDFESKVIKSAGPSCPVSVTGFKTLPQFGDRFIVVKSEKEARQIAEAEQIENAKESASTNITGSDLLKMINQRYETKDFNVIVKADVQGSLTSVVDSLRLIDTKGEVKVNIVDSGVGNISENDVRMALGSNTVIYGFNVDMSNNIKQLALRNKVQVKLFNVIYQLLDVARETIEEMLSPEINETVVGELIVKGVFRTTKDELIIGGKVDKGKINPGLLVKIKQDNKTIETEIDNLQREKQDAKEVFEGEMCGLSLKTTKKIKINEGDKLEFFTREIKKRTLN